MRWAEVDAQKIVYNPHYLMYFDVGMTEYMRAIGFRYPEGLTESGTDFYAVNANANFRASALYDDELEIAVRVSHLGRTSFVFAICIFRDDALLVDGSLTYVNASVESKKSVLLPQLFTDRVVAYEQTPPERKAQ